MQDRVQRFLFLLAAAAATTTTTTIVLVTATRERGTVPALHRIVDDDTERKRFRAHFVREPFLKLIVGCDSHGAANAAVDVPHCGPSARCVCSRPWRGWSVSTRHSNV